MAQVLALRMYPSKGQPDDKSKAMKFALMQYRKMLAKLNRALNTCEVKMCSHEWSKINPASVPSQCLKRKRNAFMNRPRKKAENGPRYNDPDRIECANNFETHLASGKAVHGRAVHVNEIVAEYMNGEDEDPVLEAQWKDIRNQFLETGLGKYVAMADVSGSMSTQLKRGKPSATSPITVCIALSLLLSEVGHMLNSIIMCTFYVFQISPPCTYLHVCVELFVCACVL
jgi:hypothetical protein